MNTALECAANIATIVTAVVALIGAVWLVLVQWRRHKRNQQWSEQLGKTVAMRNKSMKDFGDALARLASEEGTYEKQVLVNLLRLNSNVELLYTLVMLGITQKALSDNELMLLLDEWTNPQPPTDDSKERDDAASSR